MCDLLVSLLNHARIYPELTPKAAHDMFLPQPQAFNAPDLFILRGIIHDCSDPYAVKILKTLRAVAGPRTQLLIIDRVLLYACPPHPQHRELFKAPNIPEPPAPLLANMGGAASILYAHDILVCTFFLASMTLLLTGRICRCWLFRMDRNAPVANSTSF